MPKRPKRRLTSSQTQRIHDLLSRGHTHQQIAQAVGCSQASVGRMSLASGRRHRHVRSDAGSGARDQRSRVVAVPAKATPASATPSLVDEFEDLDAFLEEADAALSGARTMAESIRARVIGDDDDDEDDMETSA